MDGKSIFSNLMQSVIEDFVFAIPQRELLEFLDHYHFNPSMFLRARLFSLCAVPVDVYGFAFAVYMLSDNDCKLQTQREIAESLIVYKRNNFTL